MSDNGQIDEIKAKIDLIDLISLDCKIDDSRGAHENKHGSESGNCLTIYDDDGEKKWKCHHCKSGGDCFDWIADRDGLDPDKDFVQILETAAEFAGIELDTTGERKRVFELLTAAAEHFNSNLTNEMYLDIETHWGITKETVDKLQMGMSKLDKSLEEYLHKQGFSFDDCLKSGLFTGKTSIHSFFKGRYVFPYWVKGQVRYMIARKTDKTPDNEFEKSKFKKLRTYKKKKAEYVSKHIKNNVMFGADSLWEIGGDFCIITEGIADAIMAIQSGFPCISPVTTRFRKEDHTPILRLVRKFAKVYICMDNEDNEAGLAGAYATCKHLIDNGVDASIIDLPRAPGIDKIDLADYLRDNDADSFRSLLPLAYKPPEFFKPDPEEFIITLDNGSKKFSPMLFADWLVDRSNVYFITFIDTDEVFYYKNGVYGPYGDKKIAEMIQEIMQGRLITTHVVNETINQIRRRTYIDRDSIDVEPYMLNLKNGIYDMNDGGLEPHSPNRVSLCQLPVAYDPDATTPDWDKFLEEVLPDADDRRTVMEMFGHALIGAYEHQKWFMLAGEGANGKGVMLSVLGALLGEKNTAAVELQDLENPFASAQMYGKLANVAGDLSGHYMASTGMLKKLTGGDRIHAQFKGKQIFEFVNHASLIFAANEVPMTFDNTRAFMRRVVLIQFMYSIPPEKRIKNLERSFIDDQNLSGILNFALKGAKNLIENDGLYHRFGEEAVMKKYVELSDSVTTFLDECIEFTYDDEDTILKKDLYVAYKNWWIDKKEKGMIAKMKSWTQFGKILLNKPDMTEAGHDNPGGRAWKWLIIKNSAYEATCEKIHQTRIPDATDATDANPFITTAAENDSTKPEKNPENAGATIGKNPSVASGASVAGEIDKIVLLGLIKSGIYMLGYSHDLKEFTAFDMLIRYFKGHPVKIEGLTTELLTELLDANLDELKIEKIDERTYRQLLKP